MPPVLTIKTRVRLREPPRRSPSAGVLRAGNECSDVRRSSRIDLLEGIAGQVGHRDVAADPQRTQQRRFYVLVQSLAGDLLDDPPENLERLPAVVMLLPG